MAYRHRVVARAEISDEGHRSAKNDVARTGGDSRIHGRRSRRPILLGGLVGMEEKYADASRAAAASNRRTTSTGVSWNVPNERFLCVALEVERRVSLERLRGELCLAHVGEAPQSRFVGPVGACHQKGTVSVKQAIRLNTLVAPPSRRSGKVAEFDDSTRGDRFSKQRE